MARHDIRQAPACRRHRPHASSTRSSSRRPARTWPRWSRCCSGSTSTRADDEELNAIFRCAHSVKGGAATFGFADVAELTHQMETLLDKLRRHELAAARRAMVDVLLAAGDALKAQLARHQGAGGDAVDTRALLADIAHLSAGGAAAPAAAAVAPVHATPPCRRRQTLPAHPRRPATRACSSSRSARCRTRPRPTTCSTCSRRSPTSGTIEPLDAGHSRRRHAPLQDRHRQQRRRPAGPVHVPRAARSRCKLRAADPRLRLPPGRARRAEGRAAPTRATASSTMRRARRAPAAPAAAAPAAAAAAARGDAARAPRGGQADREGRRALESSTLRVSVEKVDQLINLVGELVITQAMLAQTSQELDRALHQQLAAGLADLRAQHARPAGSGDVDPHDPDVGGVQPLPAHAARPRRPSSARRSSW